MNCPNCGKEMSTLSDIAIRTYLCAECGTTVTPGKGFCVPGGPTSHYDKKFGVSKSMVPTNVAPIDRLRHLLGRVRSISDKLNYGDKQIAEGCTKDVGPITLVEDYHMVINEIDKYVLKIDREVNNLQPKGLEKFEGI